MSTLESLRKRSGLLVAIVGLALLAFVLTSLFEGGGSVFGGNDNAIGEIAGKTIDANVFKMKVDEAVETQKRNSQKGSLTPEETDGIVQQVWNQMINEHVMLKEYEKLGIAVSDEELYDLMVDHPHPALIRNLSDPQSGKISPMFADPVTGQISPAKIREFTQAMTDEQEAQWAQLEDYIRQVRTIEKYNNLIKKGLYVTKSAAKREYVAQNTQSNIKYVVKNYKLLADSTIKNNVTDADLNAYYSAHKNEFKQEASRAIEYVSWDIAPSQEDIDEGKKMMEKIAEDFKIKRSFSEDSIFIIAESDTRGFDQTFHTPGTLSPMIDTIMFKAEVGTVVGPYEENGSLKVSKLLASKISADSAKVRHILVGYAGSGASQTITRTKEEAKVKADSILGALKKGGKFTEFVEKFSDDGGKKMPPNKKEGEDYMGKGGDYGWLNANSGFVEPFKNAGLDGKKGDLVIIESQFGYHIIEVLDTKGSQKKVQVGTIEMKIEPSSKTKQMIFTQASEFSGKNPTNELFQKAAEGMNKRVVEMVKENDKAIAGIESAKPLIRWIYENKEGAVSEPQEYGDKYIVASITEVREKGIAPLEQVKDEVTAKVIQEKKAEIFVKEFTDAMAGAASIDAIASKMKLPVEQSQAVNFMTNQIPGSNSEPAVIGAVSVQKEKTLSKPLAGKEGVFVVYVESKQEAPELKDHSGPQKSQMQNIQPRVDYEVFNALKENAKIEEHLVRFGY